MTGEQVGVGHEPRHSTAYVSAWIQALENDPKEIRAAAVDAQRSTDWLLARERERSREDDTAAHERPDGGAGQTREPRGPERPPRVAPEVTAGSRAVAAGVQPRDGQRPATGQRAEPVTRRRVGAIGKATNGVRGGVWVPIARAVS